MWRSKKGRKLSYYNFILVRCCWPDWSQSHTGGKWRSSIRAICHVCRMSAILLIIFTWSGVHQCSGMHEGIWLTLSCRGSLMSGGEQVGKLFLLASSHQRLEILYCFIGKLHQGQLFEFVIATLCSTCGLCVLSHIGLIKHQNTSPDM